MNNAISLNKNGFNYLLNGQAVYCTQILLVNAVSLKQDAGGAICVKTKVDFGRGRTQLPPFTQPPNKIDGIFQRGVMTNPVEGGGVCYGYREGVAKRADGCTTVHLV